MGLFDIYSKEDWRTIMAKEKEIRLEKVLQDMSFSLKHIEDIMADDRALLVKLVNQNNTIVDYLKQLEIDIVDDYENSMVSELSEEEQKKIKKAKELKEVVEDFMAMKKDLNEFVNMGLDNQIVICRELTKKFETIYRGDAASLLSKISDSDLKGEITLVVSKSTNVIDIDIDILKAVESMISFNIPKREIAKILSSLTSQTANEIYEKIKDF